MGHGVTWTPAQGSAALWLTRHAAVFLPSICSPQLPVPCQFVYSLWSTQIYKESRVGLIMVGLLCAPGRGQSGEPWRAHGSAQLPAPPALQHPSLWSRIQMGEPHCFLSWGGAGFLLP